MNLDWLDLESFMWIIPSVAVVAGAWSIIKWKINKARKNSVIDANLLNKSVKGK